MQLGNTIEVKCTRKPHVDTAYFALLREPEAWRSEVSEEAYEAFREATGTLPAGSQCVKWAWKDGGEVMSCYADMLFFNICCQCEIWDE